MHNPENIDSKQSWIGNRVVEVAFILLPPFISLAFVILFPRLFQDQKGLSAFWWIVLILLIDVAHVYSTLYRTYFDKQAFEKQKSIMIGIPLVAFIAGVILYSINYLWFWRILAYTAVFHFIRQQYGLMRIYSRMERHKKWSLKIDEITIYAATVYPILYWHLSPDRNFNWFLDGDFFILNLPVLKSIVGWLYVFILITYLVKEILLSVKSQTINIPKNAVVWGTALSWYFGIVYYNGDMAFTVLNVVSHGVPYMALIWLYGNKNYHQQNKGGRWLKLLFRWQTIPVFIGLLFLFAFIEEAVWDMTVWKEHEGVFHLPRIDLSSQALSFIVPLLALPQITHYILDGFIWRIKKDEFKWSRGNPD